MQKSRFTLRALTEGAIFVALAQILSMLKLFELPQGGSISLAMLPIFIYCARWGFGPGVLASFLFGTLHFLLSGSLYSETIWLPMRHLAWQACSTEEKTDISSAFWSAALPAFWCTMWWAQPSGRSTCRIRFSE